MFSNTILNALVEAGIELTVTKLGITIAGFYKSSGVRLILIEDGKLLATSRYNQNDIIESLDDLVQLNYDWWQATKNRNPEDRVAPEEAWLPLMVASGRVKVKTTVETKTTYS